jgi:putative tricarboxylic transport membrane protein
VVVIVGLFAVSEVMRGLVDIYKGAGAKLMPVSGRLWLTREEWKRSIGPIWRGGIIGFVIGVLPGAGGTIASILSYTSEKRLSKFPEEFGHGAIEGVAGPEAANNADTAGALVPLLALGVPGGGSTAVLLGAFIMYGIQPGPLLFQTRPDLVWGLVDSMYIGNIMLLILNLPLIGLFVQLLKIPIGILYPLIVTIAAIGAYAINGSILDLYLILFFGVLGYIFDKVDIPVAPMVLSLVLGGMMEQSFRQAMTISGGNPKIFFNSAITMTLVVMSVISISLPFVLPRLKAMLKSAEAD